MRGRPNTLIGKKSGGKIPFDHLLDDAGVNDDDGDNTRETGIFGDLAKREEDDVDDVF